MSRRDVESGRPAERQSLLGHPQDDDDDLLGVSSGTARVPSQTDKVAGVQQQVQGVMAVCFPTYFHVSYHHTLRIRWTCSKSLGLGSV